MKKIWREQMCKREFTPVYLEQVKRRSTRQLDICSMRCNKQAKIQDVYNLVDIREISTGMKMEVIFEYLY
jgi:hypothetical protein